MSNTLNSDREISELIKKEEQRQKGTFTLIPSENYASTAVRTAVGSVFANKYSEGQAGKRYYQGNRVVDDLERLCKHRALAVFGLNGKDWSVNVQALSGSPANLAVYNALISPGETIMAMYLPDGGHLSHGWQLPEKKITLVSKIWNISFYHVDPQSRVFDYGKIQRQAEKIRPKLLISGGTAYPREIDYRRMSEIARAAGARYLADVAHEAGLIAGGANASPFPYADIVTMTTHKTLRGPRGALIFSRKAISPAIDQSVFPGLQGGPHNHTIAGIAVMLGEANRPEFRIYAARVVKNARLLARLFVQQGYDVVSGGTDKHLVLVDLRQSGISAWIAAWALEFAGLIVNRNTVPNDTGSSFYPSGLRLGTPAVTTRGFEEPQTEILAGMIFRVLAAVKNLVLPDDPAERRTFTVEILKKLDKLPEVVKVRQEVAKLAAIYPVPA
jgi:glycine hydroxymethyltransferase